MSSHFCDFSEFQESALDKSSGPCLPSTTSPNQAISEPAFLLWILWSCINLIAPAKKF